MRVWLWGMFVFLTLLAAGCGDAAPATSQWGGTMSQSPDRTELKDVVWTQLPGWGEWSSLPQKSRIFIHGKWAIPGEPAPVSFQCRLIRQNETLYKFELDVDKSGQPWRASGDVDWGKRTASFDFQGSFKPEQYLKYLKIMPVLTSGEADISGRVLLSNETFSTPHLSILPRRNSIFQLGSFSLTGGRFEYRDSFRSNPEISLFGARIHAGGLVLNPETVTIEKHQALIKGNMEPAAPWQSSVPLKMTARCSLLTDGVWSLTAELPEAGVFRMGGLIQPLRICRLEGQGGRQGGKWTFRGEGATCSMLLPSGIVTGNEVRIGGSMDFRFADKTSRFVPESFYINAGRFEVPGGQGRIIAKGVQGNFSIQSSGSLKYHGKADDVIFIRKQGGEVRASGVEWTLFSGNPALLFVPGNGVLQAKKLQVDLPQWKFAAETVSCDFSLQKDVWQIALKTDAAKVFSGQNALSLFRADMKISGDPAANRVLISGKGPQAGVHLRGWNGACGQWKLQLKMSSDWRQCSSMSFSGKSWSGNDGKSGKWSAENISVAAEREKTPFWCGRVELAGGNVDLKDITGNGVAFQLPFGGNNDAEGSFRADRIRYRGNSVSGLTIQMQKKNNRATLQGRAVSDLTGGVCFIQGNVSGSLKNGVMEYSMPMVTLRREMAVADILPISGGWIFSGKLGEGGKLTWGEAGSGWKRQCTFSGFARNASCMAEDISGEIVPGAENIEDAHILFRRLTSVAGEYSNGELRFHTEKGRMIWQDARFEAHGGQWKYLQKGSFQVKGVLAAGLLPIPWKADAVTGRFSGTLTMDENFSVRMCDLKSDDSGELALESMEKYRLLPKQEFDMDALAFTSAAFRNFHYKKLNLRMFLRPNGLFLRVSGEGRPDKAVPFVLGADGAFRPVSGNEPGFAGNVEIGCGYKIPLRDLAEKD